MTTVEKVLAALKDPSLVLNLDDECYDLYYAVIDIIGKIRYNKFERKYSKNENEVYYKFHGLYWQLEDILKSLGFEVEFDEDDSNVTFGIYVSEKEN